MEPSATDQLRSTARMLSAELAYARSLAVNNNSTYRVTFDARRNRIILEHSGTNAALDNLPDSAFRRPGDPATQHIVDLDDLPHVGRPVQLLGAAGYTDWWLDLFGHEEAPRTATGRVNSVEFGPLGETDVADSTVVWLACGAGDDTQYTWLAINPITGLTQTGRITTDSPPAFLTVQAQAVATPMNP
jgi:hypothetical protein